MHLFAACAARWTLEGHLHVGASVTLILFFIVFCLASHFMQISFYVEPFFKLGIQMECGEISESVQGLQFVLV